MRTAFVSFAAFTALTLGCTQVPDSACSRKPGPTACGIVFVRDPVTGKTLGGSAFTDAFDRLFLSDAPLQYEESHSLLAEVDYFQRCVGLQTQDRQLVAAKLKKFLGRTKPRLIDPQGGSSGVAPPEATLRVYAVQLLGRLGQSEDIPVIQTLLETDRTRHPELFGHPCFQDACKEAIESIRDRNR